MDTVEITLPVSKSKVVIRNYTTRADDERAEQVLYAGVTAKQDVQGTKDGKTKVEFPIANVMASQQCYAPRLVVSIDEDSNNIALRLKDLRSEDYEAIEEAVTKIVEEHSPKAKAALAA